MEVGATTKASGVRDLMYLKVGMMRIKKETARAIKVVL
jgi:hypothetical protein